MNGISEPLPGLLDDPQFQLPDLPALTDFHIAPLRDPAPATRHLNAPLPLEPVTENAINGARGSRPTAQTEPAEPKKTPLITPNDVLQARESKKPHLAISEIIEHNDGPETSAVQLPSFVSLSVVEKSPVPASLAIAAAAAAAAAATASSSSSTTTPASKRPRLDQEGAETGAAHEFGRQLPRPPHKEQVVSRPAPLLPAMVTGLHEPPPSAGLLPSIDLDQRPAVARKGTAKIQVKDILVDVDNSSAASAKAAAAAATATTTTSSSSSNVPPAREPAAPLPTEGPAPVDTAIPPHPLERQQPETQAKGDGKEGGPVKTRRTRRPWSEAEAQDLLAGVSKHGVGRWKQILEDPSFHFNDRTTVDLKDRHRVSIKEKDGPPAPTKDSPTTTTKGSGQKQNRSSPADPSDAPVASAASACSPSSAPSRRKRRAWTPGEDERLIKGIQKHGFQWTNIHADPDLDLAHRRATDLRDRIRNKYPEAYRRAESAPLRSEMRKMEKPRSSTTVCTTSTPTAAAAAASSLSSPSAPAKMRPGEGGVGGRESTATTATRPLRGSSDKEGEREQSNINNAATSSSSNTHAGLTLPSLTLDDDNDAMDWDNTLPPLLEWEELGSMGV